jgi:hypothetical protein
MTGEEILNEVRFLTGIDNWGRYQEINRAFRRICQETSFNFLREVMLNAIPIKAGVAEYEFDTSTIRKIERFWIFGTQSGEQFYHLAEEAPPQFFEEIVAKRVRPDGSNNETRPTHYKIEGNTITFTPVPDTDYATRLDIIKHIPEIERHSKSN